MIYIVIDDEKKCQNGQKSSFVINDQSWTITVTHPEIPPGPQTMLVKILKLGQFELN